MGRTLLSPDEYLVWQASADFGSCPTWWSFSRSRTPANSSNLRLLEDDDLSSNLEVHINSVDLELPVSRVE
jgi:hypothetical protein